MKKLTKALAIVLVAALMCGLFASCGKESDVE